MSDRFKFRVWDKENKEYTTDSRIFLSPNGTVRYIEDSYWYDNVSEYYDVEFCTGLKDKNDKLIYEGDIVKGKATAYEGSFEYLGCIKWCYQSELIGWYIEDKYGGGWELQQVHAKISMDNITGEVIGNIHENADLLENKDE